MGELPDSSWSTDKLGTYVEGRAQRMAIDAWYIGQALVIAIAKLRYGEKETWKARYLPKWSEATISRYCRLAKLEPDPAQLEGLPIMTAIEKYGIEKARPKVVRAARGSKVVKVEGKGQGQGEASKGTTVEAVAGASEPKALAESVLVQLDAAWKTICDLIEAESLPKKTLERMKDKVSDLCDAVGI